ncbi:MAG: winged helix-turn-helix domain-containing protein [Proteobacteria bacterium]|nr:winged helix-turn-helix domain-containing protein [Pseudomonadota bacterium]
MREMIASYLSEHGLIAFAGSGWQELSEFLEKEVIDLVILDLRLGREDGFDVLREIRSLTDIPVIITSGHRRDEIDRVIGLELGADDYITKPFGLRELLARIRAVRRRQDAERDGFDANRNTEHQRYAFGGWRLDRRSLRLTNPEGNAVPLTKSEYALLVAFLEAPQRPLTREYLLQATRIHEDIFDRSIDVQVLRLRRKLEPDPASPKFIQTERGVGYVFAVPVQRTS